MYFEKRYLQFNELVFDGYDMISDSDESLQYKGSSTAYSYGHGSYMPLKNDYLYVSERTVNMTISLKLKKVACEDRMSYIRFAEQEFGKPGKLWAIKNNEIIWALARVNNIRTVSSHSPNEVTYDVEFVIPGGVWHKADKQKTFLVPYSACALIDCRRTGSFNPVMYSTGNVECCESCEDNKRLAEMEEACGCCCDEELTPDMALGFHLDELQAFYGCDTPYSLKYDCDAAMRFNKNPAFGRKMCAESMCENSIISGRFISDTDIPTEDITITIVGNMKNPWITINGNTNVIKGEYHGKLTIFPNGDVYFQETECCEPQLLDASVWERPADMTYGWTIYPYWNGIVVNTNACCGEELSCVYIDHTAITI